MNLRRILILAGVLLILFLGMYSWNQRTHALDDLAASVGLEVGGAVLGPLRAVQDVASGFWDRYFDLVDVREENLRLKARVDELESRLLASGEDLAELRRLRELVQLPVDVSWRPLGARVLAGRLGPNAVLDSITISRGYATGGRPGTPLVTHLGLVGRVLKASPHASTALLITDPGSRVAVFGQESRAPGILMGKGKGRELEVNFVQRDASVKDGEVLVTSGLDGKYPKGLPVARVVSVAPSDYTQFMAVSAVPLVDLQHLEEVLLLEPSGIAPPPEEPEGPPPVFVGPPAPESLPGRARTDVARAPAQRAPAQPLDPQAPAVAQPDAAPRASAPAPARQRGGETATPGAGADSGQAPETVPGASATVRTSRERTGAPVSAGATPAPGPGAQPAPAAGNARPGASSLPPAPPASDGTAPRYRVVLP
ncbi:rod shape-determining protein MreC [Desulfovibrio sp.]|uniref:rod shape-determining protein MreC n=1 Tax=Desulfovibrio sp. TaxID=885 RepID=UPI002617FCFA|nr:rod shape-determining protein MreC [Desulfovibrio sp.]